MSISTSIKHATYRALSPLQRIASGQLWETDSEELRERVQRFLTALPRDARVYGIELDDNKRPVEASIAENAAELVIVEVQIG